MPSLAAARSWIWTRWPHWPDGEPVTLHRQGEVVSLLEILNLANGRLLAHHPDITRDPAMAHRIENILRRAAGVIEVAVTSAKAELWVRFNPRVVTAVTLIRLVEAELLRPRRAETARPPGGRISRPQTFLSASRQQASLFCR